MMTRTMLLAIVLSPVALVAGLPASALPAEQPLRLVTVAGHAEVQKTAAGTWAVATLGGELQPGDAARTLRGRLTLRTATGQSLRLAPVSGLSLLDAGAGDQPTRVALLAGAIWVAVMPATPPSHQLEVRAGTVVCTVTGGGVGLTLIPDGSVVVRVHHGAAECGAAGPERRWTRPVAEGQELRVPGAGPPGETRALVRDKLEADWVKLNEEQDLAGGFGGKLPER